MLQEQYLLWRRKDREKSLEMMGIFAAVDAWWLFSPPAINMLIWKGSKADGIIQSSLCLPHVNSEYHQNTIDQWLGTDAIKAA